MQCQYSCQATSIDLLQQQQKQQQQREPYKTASPRNLKRPRSQSDSNSRPPHDHHLLKHVKAVAAVKSINPLKQLGAGHVQASDIVEATTGSSSCRDFSTPRKTSPALTLSVSLHPFLFLSHCSYGLPDRLVENLALQGIKNIYPWQSSCLLGNGVLNGGRNLIYTAPTGGGKSLVADILMLKRVIDYPMEKAILVLPYVALVQEKLKSLRKMVKGILKNPKSTSQPVSQLPQWRKRHLDGPLRVVGYHGNIKLKAGWSDFDIAVCTIEKVLDRQ